VGSSTKDKGVRIDSSFPGGNIIIHEIRGNDVYLEQDLRDTEGDWFYWSFRVRGAEERLVRFHFVGSDAIGPLGPAVSTDGGQTWPWLGSSSGGTTDFSYQFRDQSKDVRFSVGMNYLEAHFLDFLTRLSSNHSLRLETLCTTPRGRRVELLRIGCSPRSRYRLVFTCRHHACEAPANYVLEGAIGAILADDSTGEWYREHVETAVVPFVDKDGVEEGDQGKYRRPHDHWHDYAGESIYSAVSSLRKLMESFDDGTPLTYVDLHCPWLHGGRHETIHFVGNSSGNNWLAIQRLSARLEQRQKGQLTFAKGDNLPFGAAWNLDQGKPLTSHNWVQTLRNVRLATVLEFPYARVRGMPVDAHAARRFGSDLAVALRCFMESG
jgi:hypothetical protein